MKRRNAEIGKMRRPIKRNKITDGFYGSAILYLKFLILWVLVICADFILEFRFEFLWPFYLLLRSVYDSFKYQGLAFSIFFVCIALTSDMLCFFFIPVHWLFFAASTYVWVQYVWHTDRGICLPTVMMWVLFVYLEAAVRLRDIKHLPGHLDLCRPFAAHCIGYPVVSLGFGCKSYIGYRMRQRKQRDVAKENEFYTQLLQQALPVESCTSTPVTNNNSTSLCNGGAGGAQLNDSHHHQTPTATTAIVPATINNNNNNNVQNNKIRQSDRDRSGNSSNNNMSNGGIKSSHNNKKADKCHQNHNNHNSHESEKHFQSHDKHNERHSDRQQQIKNHYSCSNGTAHSVPPSPHSVDEETAEVPPKPSHRRRERREQHQQDAKEREAAEYLQKLESDAKKLRNDLQLCRISEQDLRLQVAALTTSEKVSKGEITAMQRELEDMQQRLQSALSSKASDRQQINSLEKRIADERRLRASLEQQLNQERKSRKAEEARAAQVAAQSSRGECTEQCKARRRELENELAECRATQRWTEERCATLEHEKSVIAEQLRENDFLRTALSVVQEQNTHLEKSLSDENRLKLDLFSALGETKRELEIRENAIKTQEKEIKELKAKIAQVLAVMPNDTFNGPTSSALSSRVRMAESPPGSTLDPNATAYTPKSSLITSTEA